MKKKKGRSIRKRRSTPRKNRKQLPKPRSRATKKLATRAISKMRKSGMSLRRASREVGTSPRSVRRYAESALKKNSKGRYSAKAADRIKRELLIPTPEGKETISVRNSRDASQLGSYWAALQKYYETGETSGL